LSQSVRAVDRALDILFCFTREEPSLSLTQIAEKVGMSKSTVHRLLSTLENKRFIGRDRASGQYRLGFRLIEMSSLVLQDMDLQHWAHPYLQHLSDKCGETVDMGILDGNCVVYLQVVESPQRVKLAAAPGQRLPAFCTASGKAMMAFLPEEQASAVLEEGMANYKGEIPVSPIDVYAELQQTRLRGFAISEQEYERDINAVAAPILDGQKRAVAAIAIAGPSFRLTRERLMVLGESLRATTEAIAREVGFVALSAIVSKTVIPGTAGVFEQRG
jgi:IclR family KDG regulon transcriptional repressor